MDTAPRGYDDLTLVRSWAVVDDSGNLSRVEVRKDPVTGLCIKMKTPMPSAKRVPRGFKSEDE